MSLSPITWAAPVALAEFAAYFGSFKDSAFRLEMLESFAIPEETAFFKRYQAGENKPPKDFNSEWTDIIKTAKARNGSFTRVRVVRFPYIEYLKFEAAWGYSTNIAAGENIRTVDHNHLHFKTEVPILKDFWLFDSSTCFLMEYDFIGRFLGVSRVHERYVPSYAALSRELIESSKDIQESELWNRVV